MTLQDLQNIFLTQIKDKNQISVCNATFVQANYPAPTPPSSYSTMDQFVVASLQLENNQVLTVTTDVNDIVLENTYLTVTGVASFLNLTAQSITLTFSGDTQLTFNFFATLSTNWTFSDSFQYLDAYPFDGLPINNPCYFFSTAAPGTVEWNKIPFTNLQIGLNFISYFEFSDEYFNAAILKFLVSPPSQLTISGPIDATKMDMENIIYPNLDLKAEINASLNFPYNLLTVCSPAIYLQIFTTQDKEGIYWQTPLIYFGTKIKIGVKSPRQEVDFFAFIDKKASFVRFCLQETPKDPLDFSNIISLFPEGSNIESSIPSTLLQYLDEVSLKNISCDISLGLPPSINAITITIGSTKPWSFFSGEFTIQSFDVSLMMLSPLSKFSSHFFMAKASFTFSKTQNLVFDVEIIKSQEDLILSGECIGNVSLSNLINDVFSDIGLPTIPLDISFSSFGLTLDTTNKQYDFYATADVNCELFGHELLNMQNTFFYIHVDKQDASHAKYTLNLSGLITIMGIGFNLIADIGENSYFRVNMTNMTLGKIINFFVGLVSAGMEYHFPEPWNKLADVNMDTLVLEFDLTQKTISVEYNLTIDLEFIHISAVKLTYDSQAKTSEQKTSIAIIGEFLGISYGDLGSSNPWQGSLSWQPLSSSPPQVPGSTSKFDLRYLGIGQHITFSNSQNLTTVEAVLNELEASMQPLPSSPPSGSNIMGEMNGLKYDANSGWLIGIDCIIINTVSIKIIFNDPTLYGLYLSLMGAKAKSFSGLTFEILYRRVTNNLGEYSLQLKLPNSMRHLKLGDAQITLPVIGIDIFTNGNFSVDFGFPYHHDFSSSFSILISPVVGSGGFYFGLLDGSTSGQTPQVTNGSFHPVIEFGFGLDIGLAASLSVGILSAGVSVTVLGILQGTFAYFEPTNQSLPKNIFYSCQGTIGIQGRLWGEVNFAIVKASVDILIDALAQVNFEHYEPTYVSVSADVNAQVTVEVLFVHIHHSFHAHIEEQFTLGSSSTPPWNLSSTPVGSPSLKKNLMSLAYQGPLFSSFTSGSNWSWAKASGFCYTGSTQTLSLYFTPVITATQEGSSDVAKLVAALFIDHGTSTSSDPLASADFTKLCHSVIAWPLQAYFQASSGSALSSTLVGHDDIVAIFSQVTASIPSNLFTQITGVNELQSELIWNALYLQGFLTEGGETTDKFTPQVELNLPLNFMTTTIAQSIVQLMVTWTSQATFTYQDLCNYLNANFIFNIVPRPTSASDFSVGYLPAAVFPMPSGLKMSTSAGDKVDFSQFNAVSSSSSYLQDLNTYLAMTMGNCFQRKDKSSLYSKSCRSGTNPSMAQLIFQDYFFLLIRSALGYIKDLLKNYPHIVQQGDTLNRLSTQYQVKIDSIVALNQNNTNILEAQGLMLIQGSELVTEANQTLNSLVRQYSTGTLNEGKITSSSMQISDVASLNLYVSNLLQLGSVITFENINYVLPQGSISQNSLAQQFYTQPGNVLLVNTPSLQSADAAIPALTEIRIINIQFLVSSAPKLDTIEAISGYFNISPPQLIIFNPALASYSLTQIISGDFLISIPEISYIVPPNDPISILRYFGIFDDRFSLDINFSATPINLPKVQYTVKSGDTLFAIAQYLGISTTTLFSAIGNISLASNTSIAMPAIVHTIAREDSLNTIAGHYGISLISLATDNATTQNCLAVQKALSIPKPKIVISQLLSKLVENISDNVEKENIPMQNIYGAVNRFMLHGLRIPGPQQTFPSNESTWYQIPVDSLYGLTGQQLTVSTSSSIKSYSITLAQNTESVSWINLTTTNWPLALTNQEINCLNAIASQSINFTLPSPIITYKSSHKHFNFVHGTAWKTSLAPTYLISSNPATNSIASPILWRFSRSLLSEVQNLEAESSLSLKLETCVLQHISSKIKTNIPVNGYVWGSILTLKVEKPKLSKSIYTVSIDPKDCHYLSLILNSAPKMHLSILYEQNLSSGKSGFVSDISTVDDLHTIELVSTHSTSVNTATLSSKKKFLQMLFEQNVVNSGACYLSYSTELQKQGLPDYLFNSNFIAEIKLLITYPDINDVVNYHNCIVTQKNIDVQSQVFSAIAHKLILTRATVPPGYFGFELDMAIPSANNYIGALYHLLGYNIQSANGFAATPIGLPISPDTSTSGMWKFKRTLPFPGLQANSQKNSFVPLPPSDQSPYKNIFVINNKSPNQIELGFTVHDMFGNQMIPPGLKNNLNINLYYTDPILGLSQWPGVCSNYTFINGPQCQLFLDFSPSRYNLSAVETETTLEVLKRIKADLVQYTTIYYQIIQPDISVNIRCSIAKIVSNAFAISQLQGFVKEIYTYLASLDYLYTNQALTQLVTSISSHVLWKDVLTSYYISCEDLAQANETNPYLLSPNSTMILPICYTVQYQDSLNSISTMTTQTPFNQKVAVSTTQIATLNQSCNILKEGTILTIPTTSESTYTVQKGDTLKGIVDVFSSEGVTIDTLCSANTEVVQLFEEGCSITLYTTTTSVSSNETLTSMAENASSLPANNKQKITVAQLMQVNHDYVVANPGKVIIPQALSWNVEEIPSSDKSILSIVEVSSSKNTFAELVTSNDEIVNLVYANLNLTDILTQPSIKSSSSFNITINNSDKISIDIVVRQNETLNTLYSSLLESIAAAVVIYANKNLQGGFTQVQVGDIKESYTIKLEKVNTLNAIFNQWFSVFSIADFALLVSKIPLLAATNSSYLLLPPNSVEQSCNLDTSSGVHLTIFELGVELTISRNPILVNPDSSIPQDFVQTLTSATAALSPRIGDSHQSKNISLQTFAANFFSIFHPWVLATHKSQGSGNHQKLWVVPWSPGQLSYKVVVGTQAFYLVPPLATHLLSYKDIPVYAYDPQSGLATVANNIDFSDIDLDDWAKKFLQAFDRIFSAEYLVALSNINPDGTTYLSSLISQKNLLAQVITNSVQPVLDKVYDNPDRIKDVQQALQERLLENISDVYSIDSIVQFDTEVVSSGYTPTLSIAMVGQYFNLTPSSIALANIYVPVNAGVVLNLPNLPPYTTKSGPLINILTDNDYMSEGLKPTSSLPTAITDNSNLFDAATTMGVLSTSTKDKATFNISIPSAKNTLLDIVNSSTTTFNTYCGYNIDVYYFCEVIRQETASSGLYLSTPITVAALPKYSPKVTDSLEDIFNAINQEAKNQKVPCYSFLDFVINIQNQLYMNPQVVLYFIWTSITYSDYAKKFSPVDTSPLLVGKPVAKNYTISELSGENTLNAVVNSLSNTYPVPTLYVAQVIKDIQNIFLPNTLIENYLTEPADTLTSVASHFFPNSEDPLASLINAVFEEKFEDMPILSSGKELNLSWIEYGQSYCLQSVAQVLNVTIADLVFSNLYLNVYTNYPEDKSLITLSKYLANQGYYKESQVIEPISYTILTDPYLLVEDTPIGILSYESNPKTGQSLIQISDVCTLDDLINSNEFVQNPEIGCGFHRFYMASLIQQQPGIFQKVPIKLYENGKYPSYTPNANDTLNTVAAQFSSLSFDQFINELAGIDCIDPQFIFHFKWSYTTLENANNQNTTKTLIDIARYFQCDVGDLIAANLNSTTLLKEGVEINYAKQTHTVRKNDTFNTILTRFLSNNWNPSELNIPESFLTCSGVVANQNLLNPFAKVYLLKRQPGLTLSSTKSSLQNGISYLTFLLEESNKNQERVFLDLHYFVSGIEFNRVPITSLPGYFDYEGLTLIQPASFSIGQIQVPIPLRNCPITPSLVSQQANAYTPEDEKELSLQVAKSWTYQYSYIQENKSQDEIELNVNFNVSSGAQSKNKKSHLFSKSIASKGGKTKQLNLFKALAQFIYVEKTIIHNLNSLINVNSASISSDQISIAIKTFLNLVQDVVTAWKEFYEDSFSSFQQSSSIPYRCLVSEYIDTTATPSVLNIMVTAQNDPISSSINLPYVEADSNYWTPVTPPTSLPLSKNFALYSFNQINGAKLPDKQSRTVKFFDEFDIFNYQNVWAGISLLRNTQLLSNTPTNPSFIYKTPEIKFSEPVVPFMDRRQTVRFFPELSFADTMQKKLTNYIYNLFVQLFNASTATWEIEICCRYAYSISNNGLKNFEVNIPIVFHAKKSLSLEDNSMSLFVQNMVENILIWQQAHGLVLKTNSVWNFDISVFSPQTSEKPILHLHNVYLDCFPSPIQEKRILPLRSPDDPATLCNKDGVNPLVTNISRKTNILSNTATRELLAYGDPVRIKSWISGMVWADNTTSYYIGAKNTVAISRQQPIYADPIIGLYVCNLHGYNPNYNDYFSQSGQTAENDMAVYGDTGWQAGFHLSMPNPSLNVGSAYNSGQGQYTYNNDALVYNASGAGWDPQKGQWIPGKGGWTAATSTTNNDPASFTINKSPPSSYQVGLCQYGGWRDTLSVAPAHPTGKGFELAFAPQAARLVRQTDCHAEFVMANEGIKEPNQILKMDMTQGSPFVSFTAANLDAVRIAGIFTPPVPTGYYLTPGKISSTYVIPKLQTITGEKNGSINYVIIYQQVNFFNAEKVASPQVPAQRMNWVAFAVYWDPTVVNLQLSDKNHLALYLTFMHPEQDNYFVIAGLPSQVANQYSGEDFNLNLAQPWAEALGQYAFNFVTDTHVNYYVGEDKEKKATAPNALKTYYTWKLKQQGPVSAINTSVMLLQPHHYASFCDGQGKSVLDNPANFLEFGSGQAAKSNKYWIARGKLEALVGSEFSTTYIYPNLLPYLPYFNLHDFKTSSNNPQCDYNMAEMAAAMSGYDWVAEFPDSSGDPQDGPATTSMANSNIMQDSYNAVKGFLKSAKLISLLLQMAKSHYFDDANVMELIDGTSELLKGRSIYSVGNRYISENDSETFTPGGALHDFIQHLMEAYTYYFNFNPQYVAKNFEDPAQKTNLLAKTYYYSYYDSANHHLFVYPAAGNGSSGWPTNVSTAGLRYDGYGTVSMLNDHAYTYGYLIAAAGILGIALKDPALEKLTYQPFNLATYAMDLAKPVCSKQEWEAWSSWVSNWTPIIDQLVMDIAYDPDINEEGGYQNLPGLTYPKMEYIDLWSGAGWTDGFLISGSLQGHNVNSPWEQMQAWAGIILWGHATERPQIVNLGIYLYTMGFYGLEAYHYNAIKTYIPESIGSDYGAYDTYLPKATNDFYSAFDMSWKGTYTPLANAQQAFIGKTMWDTMMSDKSPHQTAHVTYFYQGNVRVDTTYWNSPVGLQMTSIYPHNPYIMALSRNQSYMSDWAAAIQFQNNRSSYKVPYPTTCNLLYAQLNLNFSVSATDCSKEYQTTSNLEGAIIPIPYAAGNEGNYGPTSGEKPTNPEHNAFNYLIFDKQKTPYQWFWEKCSGLNTGLKQDQGDPPWISAMRGETLSMYLSSDKSAAETLLYFYHYSCYGTPDFSVYADAKPLVSSTAIIQPMTMAWCKQGIRSFIAYNSNPVDVVVSFYVFGSASNKAITTQTVNPYTMCIWPSAVIYSFTADPLDILPGQSTTVHWDVRGAAQLTLSDGGTYNQVLKNEPKGSIVVTPQPENLTYTLTLQDIYGYEHEKKITFEFSEIKAFWIDPMHIVPNSEVTLVWEVSGARKIEITNGSDYYFSSTEAIGNTMAKATVQNPSFTLIVYPNNTAITTPIIESRTVEFIEIISFTATPQEIPVKNSVTLSWQTTGAKSIAISNNDHIMPFVEPEGSCIVYPKENNPTYTLTLYPEGSHSHFTLMKEVTIAFFAINSFKPIPSEIEIGDSVMLKWSVSAGNVKEITITDEGSFNYKTIDTEGSVSVTPTLENPTFTLTLYSSIQNVVPLKKAATVVFAQIESFVASPTTIKSGETTTLSWKTTGSQKIVIKSQDGRFDKVSNDATGFVQDTPTKATTYTLTLYPENTSLKSIQSTVTVNVDN